MDGDSVVQAFHLSSKLYYTYLTEASKSAFNASESKGAAVEPMISETEKFCLYRTAFPLCFFNCVQQAKFASEEEARSLLGSIQEEMGQVPWVLAIEDLDPTSQKILKPLVGEGNIFGAFVNGEEEFCGMKINLDSFSDQDAGNDSSIRVKVHHSSDEIESETKTEAESGLVSLKKSCRETAGKSAECLQISSFPPDSSSLGSNFLATYSNLVDPEKGDCQYHIFSFFDQEDGKAVSTASVMIMPDLKVASIFEVGTRAEYRRNGLASLVVKKCLSFAKEVGCHWAILNASKQGKSIYEKIGFSVCDLGSFSLFIPNFPFPTNKL